MMEKVRHVRKWEGHSFKTNSLSLLLLISSLLKLILYRGSCYLVIYTASGIIKYKYGILGINAV